VFTDKTKPHAHLDTWLVCGKGQTDASDGAEHLPHRRDGPAFIPPVEEEGVVIPGGQQARCGNSSDPRSADLGPGDGWKEGRFGNMSCKAQKGLGKEGGGGGGDGVDATSPTGIALGPAIETIQQAPPLHGESKDAHLTPRWESRCPGQYPAPAALAG